VPLAAQYALLNTLTATGSGTTLSDTTSLTGTYSVHEIVFENLIPATAGQALTLLVHSGGSFPITSYVSMFQTSTNDAALTGGANTAGIFLVSSSQNQCRTGGSQAA
jgi:hypothetical protein